MWQLSIICYLTRVVVPFTNFPFLQSDMIKVIAGVMCPCSRSLYFWVEDKVWSDHGSCLLLDWMLQYWADSTCW